MADVKEILKQQSTSPFLKGTDIEGVEVLVTVSKVELGKQERSGKEVPQLILHFEGKEKKLGLNSTNTKIMAKYFGYDDEEWVGKQIVLYTIETNNPTTGELGPGIRIKVNQDESVNPEDINL